MARFAARCGLAVATFDRWKKVYAGMGVAEIRRLEQLEEENGKPKRLVADLTLDKSMVQDALQKSGEARYSSRWRLALELRMRLKDLAESRVRYGYCRLHVLLRRKVWTLFQTSSLTISHSGF